MTPREIPCDLDFFVAVATNEARFLIVPELENEFHVGEVLKIRQTKFTAHEMQNGSPLTFTGKYSMRVVAYVLRRPDVRVLSLRPLSLIEKAALK